MYWEGFSPIGFVQVNSCVTVIEITLHSMSDVVVRLIILRFLALVKGFITSTGFLLLERQLSWVITFITEEIYLFDTIIPQLDHMVHSTENRLRGTFSHKLYISVPRLTARTRMDTEPRSSLT